MHQPYSNFPNLDEEHSEEEKDFYNYWIGKRWWKCFCGAYFKRGEGFNNHCSEDCYHRMAEEA